MTSANNYGPTSSSGAPSVLVLLATYNGGHWIRDQIASILAQRTINVRIVINDDGSTDNTVDLIHAMQQDARLTLLKGIARTGSAAQNFFHLIRQTPAGGHDFIALSDQDDVWNPDKLARGCSALAAGAAHGYSSAVIAEWPDGRRTTLRQAACQTESDFLFEGAGQGCTFILTVHFYERLRAFLIEHPTETADLHFHDWAIYALSRCWDLKWIFDPLPSMVYRQHDANDTGARNSLSGIRKRIGLIRNGWYRNEIDGISRFCRAAAPKNTVVASWASLLDIDRRLAIALFCWRGGRRRTSDRLTLVAAALLGCI